MSGFRHALRSDVGRIREGNEDFALADAESGLYVLADGMGGHVAGDVASHTAVETALRAVRQQPRPRRVRDEAQVLAQATVEANSAVLERATREGLEGMGTTLTLLRIHGRTAVVSHVGDSRAYLITRTVFEALTTDQTVVALLLRNGLITPEQAAVHPERHVLTQALGTQAHLEPAVTTRRLSRGARLLLSSDGLHDIVPHRELVRMCRMSDLDAAVDAMIERANACGGPDNITALLIQS